MPRFGHTTHASYFGWRLASPLKSGVTRVRTFTPLVPRLFTPYVEAAVTSLVVGNHSQRR
eukprot:4695396-Prymnesium_polylepis.1